MADPNLGHRLEPHVGAEVEVEEEDGDGEYERGEDGHPGEDVEEETDESGQLADDDNPTIDSDAMEQVDHTEVNLKTKSFLLASQ